MKQQDSDGCGLAVLAMATGQTLRQVARQLPPAVQHALTAQDAADYLRTRGHSACIIRPEDDDGAWRGVLERMLPGQRAILGVRRGADGHAVYWTGDSISDPDPAVSGTRLGDYEVLEVVLVF